MKFNNRPNKQYIVTEGKASRTIWESRSVAVNAVIIIDIKGERMNPYVLVSKRGPAAADFQGLYNVIAGYLDWDESGGDAIKRETWEECGINIFDLITNATFLFSQNMDDPWGVKTSPKSNRQNVSLRYGIYIGLPDFPKLSIEHNEVEGEVEDPRWISVHDIDDYEWAFDHDKTIKQYMEYLNIVG